MAQKFTDGDNARVDEQRAVMAKSEADGVCPFCPEHLEQYHKDPILLEGLYWIATPNSWPYEHTKHQILLISRSHVEHIKDLPEGAGEELIQMTRKLAEQFNTPGGAICMRFGDTLYSAGSVKHVHAQLIVPDIEAADYEPVRFKIGATKK